jgi:uncharacterized protein YecE (DUF72 family)
VFRTRVGPAERFDRRAGGTGSFVERRGADRMSIRIGCSGWSYEHWRGVLYPESSSSAGWLALYAGSFDTVEVNATFYRLPRSSTVARWAATTPPGFCFAVKGSRYVTHVRRLREMKASVARLEERIAALRESSKLGPILWQLPPTFKRDDSRLEAALAALPNGRHAFEFRHASWFDDDVYALLCRYGIALVVADRAPEPPTPWVDTAGWSYLRFHSGRGRNGKYSASELGVWADRIAERCRDGYVYFNNDWHGYAVKNALALQRRLARLVPQVATGS